MNSSICIRARRALILLLTMACVMTVSAFATDRVPTNLKKGDAIEGTNYIVTSIKNYTVAPDITERIIITNNASGTAQTVANVMEVDLNNDQAKLVAGYGNLNPKTQGWNLKSTTEQAHIYEQATGENVVGGVNAAIFNTETGEPGGHLVMRGVTYQDKTNYAFVAVFDDGSVGMFDRGVTLAQAEKEQSEKLGYTVKIEEAISGWIVLVNGDAVATGGTNVGNYSRSAIGMKEDGTIVIMESDGSLLPRSNGYTLAEMGYMMKALGCTYAIELDEGGSSTYISQRASEDDVTMKNAAGGGEERLISSSILVVSLYDGVVTPGEDENHEHSYTYDRKTGQLECVECGETGNAASDYYSGWAKDRDSDSYLYFVGGNAATGDVKMEDNSVAYFTAEGLALQGEVEILGEPCTFDKGAYISSRNKNVVAAGYTGTNIQWVYYSDGTFKMNGEGDMRDYTVRGGMPWAEYRQQFKKIIIGADVTAVGVYAFNEAIRCTEVVFEDGSELTKVNGSAFYYMYSLKTITLPETVTYIGNYAFGYCFALTNVYMPEALTNVYDNAFNYCDKNDWDKIPLVLSVVKDSYAYNYAVKNNLQYTLRETSGHVVHDWDEGKVTAEPTCTGAGAKVYTCKTCGGTKTVVLKALGHNYEEKTVAATCTEEGYTLHTCTRCGDSYKDDNKEALGHDWDEGKVTTEATCTKAGEKTYTCKTCGETKTEEIAALDHAWDEGKVTTEATCTEKGVKTYTCKNCTETKTEEIAALGHDWDQGEITKEATDTEKGEKTFTCKTCGETRTEEIPAIGYKNPFVDVVEGRFFYNAVAWAVKNNITNGMSDTTFEPKTECTRGHVITFLWRAAGCPEPESDEHPFTDLDETRFYYKAVLWGVEQGIVEGMTATTFEPWTICTRSQVATFLYRFAGEPELETTETKFTDLDANRFYYKAVLWADANNIANGMTDTTFEPKTECTRGHVVTFLYRLMVAAG